MSFRSALMTVIVLALTFSAVPSAQAKDRGWNKEDEPLIAKDDGKKKASGYGYWNIGTTSNGTRSRAYGYLKDNHKNGHNVFFELFTQTNSGICFAPQYTECSSKYYTYDKQFSEFNKETWNGDYWSHKLYASTGVSSGGNYARASMRVGESNKGPDLHSGPTLTKGNKY